jgi:hypothetical protein
LGFQKLNNIIWDELPENNRVIGLGQNQETHAFVRKYLDKVLCINEFNKKIVESYVKDFFDECNTYKTTDYKIFIMNFILIKQTNTFCKWIDYSTFDNPLFKGLVSFLVGERPIHPALD